MQEALKQLAMSRSNHIRNTTGRQEEVPLTTPPGWGGVVTTSLPPAAAAARRDAVGDFIPKPTRKSDADTAAFLFPNLAVEHTPQARVSKVPLNVQVQLLQLQQWKEDGGAGAATSIFPRDGARVASKPTVSSPNLLVKPNTGRLTQTNTKTFKSIESSSEEIDGWVLDLPPKRQFHHAKRCSSYLQPRKSSKLAEGDEEAY